MLSYIRYSSLMSQNNIVILIFIGYLLTFIFSHYRVAYKKIGSKNFWRFRTFSDLIVVFSFIIGFVLLVQFKGEKKFDSPDDMVSFGVNNSYSDLIIKGCQSVIKEDLCHLDCHYLMAKNVYYFGSNKQLNDYIARLYEMITKPSDNSKDVAYLMLGYLDYYSNYNYNFNYLEFISNKKIKYYHYLLGLKSSNTNEAIGYFKNEIKYEGFLEGSTVKLYDLFVQKSDQKSILQLAENKSLSKFLSRSVKKEIFFKNTSFSNYIIQIVGRTIDEFTLLSALTAFLISFLWMNFLRRFDIYETEKWKYLLAVFGLGSIATFFVYPLGDVLEYVFHFSYTNTDVLNDFIYCSVVIGAVEELVKIVPFLLVLRFFKFINEPYDYILYGSVSALGFAFMENILYFNEYQFHVIFIRTVYSVVGHMFWTSIIAYGFIKINFNRKTTYSSLAVVFGSFTLACVGHGAYDFLLFYNLGALNTIFFFLSLIAFVFMINNSLNISNFYNYEISLRREKMAFQLIIGLVGVYMLQYFIIGVNYGSSYANTMALNNMLYGLMIITFLAILFSSISINRGEWKAISVFSFIPYFTFNGVKTFFYSKTPRGLTLRFFTTKTNPFLATQLPVVGVVVKELTISNQKGWYLVEFNKPITVRNYLSLKAIIRPVKENTSLRKNKIKVDFLMIPNNSFLNKELVLKEDFFPIDRVYTICLS